MPPAPDELALDAGDGWISYLFFAAVVACTFLL